MDEEVDDEHDPLIGTMVGRYRVEKRIGQGGMGAVYEILQPAIHKRMALKLLHEEYTERKEIVQRFFDEARAVNLISHPNIVDINDFSKLPDGRPFIIMEFLEGRTLEEYLEEKGALDPNEVVALLQQITSALQAAHNTNIVHRDLKPENIFLVPLPDGKHLVKVLDFGIAKLSDDKKSGTKLTATGIVLGTPTYMSPEQAKGHSQKADHRTDIYSLGIILYQMLAGTPPFVGKTLAELMVKHIQVEAPDLSETRSELSPKWSHVVRQALNKDPEERFQSMQALFSAAKQANHQSFSPAVPTLSQTSLVNLPQPATAAKSNKAFWVGGAGLALVAALGLTLWIQSKSEEAGGKGSAKTGPALLSPIDAPETTALTTAIDAGSVTTMAIDSGPIAQVSDANNEPTAKDAAVTVAVQAIPDAASALSKPDKKVVPLSAIKRGKGTLLVQSSPWAIVYLDGKKLGATPQKKTIPSGRHRVRLRSDFSDTPKSYKFTLKPGQTHTIKAKWN